ncbi:MAG: tyrosine decarboxylase MfnA [Thermoplasmata archaeon]
MRAKDAFPPEGLPEKQIIDRILRAAEEDMDFDSGRIFGSMCTSPLDIAKKVHNMFLNTNLGNPGLYRGTVSLEKEIHEAVASLVNAPKGYEAISVGGATEGNILALWNARNKSGKKKVMLPESAHFSFKKACDILEMKPVMIPLDDDYMPDLEVLEKNIDRDTAIIVGIAGTTELGIIEPIEAMADIAGNIHLHVDGALGGFTIPFLKEQDKPRYDFSIPGVDSLVLDPHKMGLSTIPLGLYYSREKHPISVESPYLTGEHQKTITGTRTSASIPAFWSVVKYLGFQGYVSIVEKCIDNTRLLFEMGQSIGLKPIIEPVLNIVSFHHERPYEVVERMDRSGWNISRTVNPKGLRFVVMPHVTEESIRVMLPVLEESI